MNPSSNQAEECLVTLSCKGTTGSCFSLKIFTENNTDLHTYVHGWHSILDDCGQWVSLDSELEMRGGEVVGTKVPTGHSLLISCRFEQPFDPENTEAADLQRKLEMLNNTMDQEARAEQARRQILYNIGHSGYSEDSDYTSDLNYPVGGQGANSSASQFRTAANQLATPQRSLETSRENSYERDDHQIPATVGGRLTASYPSYGTGSRGHSPRYDEPYPGDNIPQRYITPQSGESSEPLSYNSRPRGYKEYSQDGWYSEGYDYQGTRIDDTRVFSDTESYYPSTTSSSRRGPHRKPSLERQNTLYDEQHYNTDGYGYNDTRISKMSAVYPECQTDIMHNDYTDSRYIYQDERYGQDDEDRQWDSGGKWYLGPSIYYENKRNRKSLPQRPASSIGIHRPNYRPTVTRQRSYESEELDYSSRRKKTPRALSRQEGAITGKKLPPTPSKPSNVLLNRKPLSLPATPGRQLPRTRTPSEESYYKQEYNEDYNYAYRSSQDNLEQESFEFQPLQDNHFVPDYQNQYPQNNYDYESVGKDYPGYGTYEDGYQNTYPKVNNQYQSAVIDNYQGYDSKSNFKDYQDSLQDNLKQDYSQANGQDYKQDLTKGYKQQDLVKGYNQESLKGYNQQDYNQQDYNQQDYSQQDYKQNHKKDYNQQDYNQQDYKQDYNQQDYKQDYNQQDYKQDYNQQDYKQDSSTGYGPQNSYNQESLKDYDQQNTSKDYNQKEVYKQDYNQEDVYKQDFNQQKVYKQDYNQQDVYKQNYNQEPLTDYDKQDVYQQDYKQDYNQQDYKQDYNQQDYKQDYNQQDYKQDYNQQDYNQQDYNQQDYKQDYNQDSSTGYGAQDTYNQEPIEDYNQQTQKGFSQQNGYSQDLSKGYSQEEPYKEETLQDYKQDSFQDSYTDSFKDFKQDSYTDSYKQDSYKQDSFSESYTEETYTLAKDDNNQVDLNNYKNVPVSNYNNSIVTTSSVTIDYNNQQQHDNNKYPVASEYYQPDQQIPVGKEELPQEVTYSDGYDYNSQGYYDYYDDKQKLPEPTTKSQVNGYKDKDYFYEENKGQLVQQASLELQDDELKDSFETAMNSVNGLLERKSFEYSTAGELSPASTLVDSSSGHAETVTTTAVMHVNGKRLVRTESYVEEPMEDEYPAELHRKDSQLSHQSQASQRSVQKPKLTRGDSYAEFEARERRDSYQASRDDSYGSIEEQDSFKEPLSRTGSYKREFSRGNSVYGQNFTTPQPISRAESYQRGYFKEQKSIDESNIVLGSAMNGEYKMRDETLERYEKGEEALTRGSRENSLVEPYKVTPPLSRSTSPRAEGVTKQASPDESVQMDTPPRSPPEPPADEVMLDLVGAPPVPTQLKERQKMTPRERWLWACNKISMQLN
ncbi:Similar to unc-13: Phorbol ester/diacylglycerol-binding protein unc-13 (Caenorhabditis elegans), partial [Cotesia congregata]